MCGRVGRPSFGLREVGMKAYQKILVCIDQPDRDCQMLDYAGAVCRVAEAKELHLLHVVSAEPAGEEAEPQETASPEITAEALRAMADEHLKGHGQEEIVCQVVTGSTLLEILRYALDKEIDLIVIGRQAAGTHKTEQEAVLARRLAQQATCSVLVLPEGALTKADKILCPVRDSACSANAVNAACQIADAIDGTVLCLNVFPVGSRHVKVGSTLEEQTALLQRGSQRECERLLGRVDTGGVKVVTKCVPDLYSQPLSIILDEVKNESADLVVIGARGRTGAAGVLLGKVTEELIRESAVPVLAVKKKGECIGVLQALLILAG